MRSRGAVAGVTALRAMGSRGWAVDASRKLDLLRRCSGLKRSHGCATSLLEAGTPEPPGRERNGFVSFGLAPPQRRGRPRDDVICQAPNENVFV